MDVADGGGNDWRTALSTVQDAYLISLSDWLGPSMSVILFLSFMSCVIKFRFFSHH